MNKEARKSEIYIVEQGLVVRGLNTRDGEYKMFWGLNNFMFFSQYYVFPIILSEWLNSPEWHTWFQPVWMGFSSQLVHMTGFWRMNQQGRFARYRTGRVHSGTLHHWSNVLDLKAEFDNVGINSFIHHTFKFRN